MNDMDKMKFLEFDVNPGYVLYIPPYWWYSIKFSGENNLICGITYNSIMNYVANIPNLALYFIQQHNIKKKITKTLDIENNKDIATHNVNETAAENIPENIEHSI
jgi:ribosomal protein L16 Arg81 hydroxylase